MAANTELQASLWAESIRHEYARSLKRLEPASRREEIGKLLSMLHKQETDPTLGADLHTGKWYLTTKEDER